MNLIIEQGNTYTKVAVYGKESFVTSFVYKKFDIIVVADLMKEFSFTNGILSTVINKDETLINFLEDYLDFFLVLDETTPLPIQVRYDTPGTLGKDRVAAAVGAHFLQPGKDLLVIDAGTAITYEVIEAPGIYIGGNISPGMTTRFKALNHFTEKLPLVVEKEEISFVGHSTETAIQAGVVNGIIYEMEGYINDLRLKYPDLLVFLTGGHSFYFERRLKNSIFADINLVMTGLNRILEYNVEN